jgi:hypothetical protein
MTKAGASGPKARARKAQQATGASYTQLRSTPQAAGRGDHDRCQIVQFLTESSSEVGSLPVQIAGAWARAGMRVLLLHEYEHAPSHWRMDLHSRRAKIRNEAKARIDGWPGPRSTVLWQAAPGAGRGIVVSQHVVWSLHSSDRGGRLSFDDTPLREILETSRDHFDAIVLMSSWPQHRQGARCIVLAFSDIPDSETIPFTYDRDVPLPRFPLTPQQSAAVLRDRHLRFLASYASVPLLGMIISNRPSVRRPPRQVDAAFRAGLEEDMKSVGLPLLGHITLRARNLSERMSGDDNARTELDTPSDEGVTQTAQAIREFW